MENRTTPENIASLKDGEVFVFGSNLAGRHGAGAAKAARKFGAEYGVWKGMSGMTYAIPTKDALVKNALPLASISTYVEEFIGFAEKNPQYEFLVTEIGCGLSGYSPEDIAPMFESAVPIRNIALPERFWDVIIKIFLQRIKG